MSPSGGTRPTMGKKDRKRKQLNAFDRSDTSILQKTDGASNVVACTSTIVDNLSARLLRRGGLSTAPSSPIPHHHDIIPPKTGSFSVTSPSVTNIRPTQSCPSASPFIRRRNQFQDSDDDIMLSNSVAATLNRRDKSKPILRPYSRKWIGNHRPVNRKVSFTTEYSDASDSQVSGIPLLTDDSLVPLVEGSNHLPQKQTNRLMSSTPEGHVEESKLLSPFEPKEKNGDGTTKSETVGFIEENIKVNVDDGGHGLGLGLSGICMDPLDPVAISNPPYPHICHTPPTVSPPIVSGYQYSTAIYPIIVPIVVYPTTMSHLPVAPIMQHQVWNGGNGTYQNSSSMFSSSSTPSWNKTQMNAPHTIVNDRDFPPLSQTGHWYHPTPLAPTTPSPSLTPISNLRRPQIFFENMFEDKTQGYDRQIDSRGPPSSFSTPTILSPTAEEFVPSSRSASPSPPPSLGGGTRSRSCSPPVILSSSSYWTFPPKKKQGSVGDKRRELAVTMTVQVTPKKNQNSDAVLDTPDTPDVTPKKNGPLGKTVVDVTPKKKRFITVFNTIPKKREPLMEVQNRLSL